MSLHCSHSVLSFFFFFNDPATTEIYTLSLHDALPIFRADIRSLEDQLTLKTSGGSINAIIPSGLGLDLDLSGNRVNTELQNFSGKSEKNSIQGSMNGGGIEVTMRTSGGSVNLDYHSGS